MGIFGRLGTLIRSWLNDVISKAEDPEKMLTQVLLDMRQQLVEAKKQVAVAIADEKRLAKELEAEQVAAREWEKKAMMAVRSGDDGLAREALARKAEHDQLAAQYQQQFDLQHASVEKLKEALRSLNAKIEEAKRKKNILVARQKRAEAQRAIQATMQGIHNASAFETFERLSVRVEQLEAEAEAQAAIASELVGDSLQQRFKALEQDHGVDDALSELKAKMGLLPMGEPAPMLPPGASAQGETGQPVAPVAVEEPVSIGGERK